MVRKDILAKRIVLATNSTGTERVGKKRLMKKKINEKERVFRRH